MPATAIYHSDLRSARKRETLAATAMPETRPALRAEAENGQIQALQAEKKQGLKLVLSDALALRSRGYQGLKVSNLKVVSGSQKCIGISKNCGQCRYC